MVKASATAIVAQVVPYSLEKVYEVGMALCKGVVPHRGRERPPPSRRRGTRRAALRGVLSAEML